MNKFSYLLVTAGLLFFSSCQKEIEYKGESEESLLVLNCIAENDSTFAVGLERSRFFLESNNGNFKVESGAVITLVNQTSGQSYSVGTPDIYGKYIFPIAAIAGNSYSITAIHADYKSVSAAMIVPTVSPILSVDTTSYTSVNGDFMKADVKWNDPAGDDFYVMTLSVVNVVSGLEYLSQPIGSADQSMDELTASEFGDGENFYPQLFFTDDFFDGSQKTLEVKYPINFIQLGPDEHYKFMLYRCTEETYKYLISTQKAQNAANDFFSEPVKVFTNIENGYGIFGAMTKAVFVK